MKIVGSRDRNTNPKFAKRSLGQNFLADVSYIKRIIAMLGDIERSLVIEVGPGRGALTDHIAGRAGRLIAIELDTNLANMLAQKFSGMENVEIREADILSVDLVPDVLEATGYERFKLIANLPYNISTPFLQLLTESAECVSEAVLMLQREVVERITAEPGNSDRGFITVFLEAFFRTEKLFDVPPQVFRPVPKVWSSVLRLVPQTGVEIENEALFRKLVSDGFKQKRKTILNNLKAADGSVEWKLLLEKSEITERLRPEALTLQQWIDLANALCRHLDSNRESTRYTSGR